MLSQATRRTFLLWLITLITFGSGVVNVLSVIRPSLLETTPQFIAQFPWPFAYASRDIALLIGFALIVLSFNMYRRRRRAYYLVLTLSAASVLFHLVSGLRSTGPRYAEIAVSLVLVGLLLWSRREFTVRSRDLIALGDWPALVRRLSIVFGFVLLYGVVGFWLLDARQFGRDFALWEAVGQTLRHLLLIGNDQLVPQTVYAAWFLHSLTVVSLAAVGYALFAVLRPAVYQYSTLPQERDHAARLLEQYGRSSLDYFKLWPDKELYFSASGETFVAYRVAGTFAVVLGDPVGPEAEIEKALREFIAYCRHNGWRVAFHQTAPDFLPIYKTLRFRRFRLGEDAIVDLTQISLTGGANKTLRKSVNRMENQGLRIVYQEPPVPDELLAQAKEVSDEWLQMPGRRERAFTQGQFEPEYIRSTPLFAAVDADGKMQAFVNLVPSYRAGEATFDLMRRRRETHAKLMDYLFIKLFLFKKEQGFRTLNLGMAPFGEFQEGETPTREERLIYGFAQHMDTLFNFEGLRNYKAKFAHSWEPAYTFYRSPLDLPRLALALSQLTETDPSARTLASRAVQLRALAGAATRELRRIRGRARVRRGADAQSTPQDAHSNTDPNASETKQYRSPGVETPG